MNREGRTYRSERDAGDPKFVGSGKTNGSVILVTRSEAWNPERPNSSNYTHRALVLECPVEPGMVGREVRIDERVVISGTYAGSYVQRSTFETDDAWVEI